MIKLYMLTAEKKYDYDVESVYDDLFKLLGTLRSNEINLVLGDFSAEIGKGKRGNLVAEYGLGEANDRGDILYDFCQTNLLMMCNTLFKVTIRRLFTWTSPFDNPVRNQIDYILIYSRFRNCVKRATTYPCADKGVGSTY